MGSRFRLFLALLALAVASGAILLAAGHPAYGWDRDILAAPINGEFSVWRLESGKHASEGYDIGWDEAGVGEMANGPHVVVEAGPDRRSVPLILSLRP